MDSIIKTINFVVDKSGKILGFFLIPVLGLVFFEVVARYVFKSPTMWTLDANYYMTGICIIIGGAYGLQVRQHIAMDVFYNMFPPRVKSVIDIIISVLLLILFVVILLLLIQDAISAVEIREAFSTVIMTPAYPLKVIVILGPLLLVLQGIVNLIMNIRKFK